MGNAKQLSRSFGKLLEVLKENGVLESAEVTLIINEGSRGWVDVK